MTFFNVSKPPRSPDSDKNISRFQGNSPKSAIDELFISTGLEKVSPPKDVFIPSDADYDKNPTVLYRYVENRDWNAVIDRCNKCPEEASIFLYRNEASTDMLRWKQLPLHAALVFKGKATAIASLIEAFPQGVMMHDDQGMLPAHLAFRYNASESVINLLLETYPESLNMPDRKGRLPIELTKTLGRDTKRVSKSPLTLRSYIANYDRYARDKIEDEQRKLFMEKSKDLMEKNKKEIKDIMSRFEHLESCEFKCEEYLREAMQKIKAQDSVIARLKKEKQEIKKDLKTSEIETAGLRTKLELEKSDRENLMHASKKEESRRVKDKKYFEAEKDEYEKTIEKLKEEVRTLNYSKEASKEKKLQNDEDLKLLANSSKNLINKVQKLELHLSMERSRFSSLQAKLNGSGDKEDQLMNRVCELTQSLMKRSSEKKELIKKHTENMKNLLDENAALRRRCIG